MDSSQIVQQPQDEPAFVGSIEINQQVQCPVDHALIKRVVGLILGDAQVRDGAISVAIVDDPTIHKLNIQFLQHDYPTDVLSFVLESDSERAWLEGEVVVSVDTATSTAADLGCPPANELMLYIVHGTLHLVGMQDSTPAQKQQMQKEEIRYLNQIGLARAT